MAAVAERPFPPGAYDVVVVGSGPGGLQVSYYLKHFGVQHAVLSRDDAPGGMFQRFPIYQRLITWTKPDAPVERGTREYEWYDHNSLVAEDPDLQALVPRFMARDFDLPSREEMLNGLAEFASRARIDVRYGCTWERTRRERDAIVLETSDGEYRCRAAVFAIGITEPWVAPVPGLEDAAHYVATKEPSLYQGLRVFVVGKRNSGFEVAQSLLPWARQVILASPRPVDTKALALSALRVRYLHPYDEYSRGGPGTYVLDGAIDRVVRGADAYRVVVDGTTWEGRLELEVDEVIAATGFRTPLRDLPELGVATVNDGRVPALSPFWESVSAPGIFFAGNTTQGARGLGKRGLGAASGSVNGFRYNARVLAGYLAQRLGSPITRQRLPARELVPFVLHELSHAPELWIQKGYLARVLTFADGVNDHGILPVSHFLDESGPDAIAAAIEVDDAGTIFPIVYLRRSGRISERPLPPHPLHVYEDASYRRAVEAMLA